MIYAWFLFVHKDKHMQIDYGIYCFINVILALYSVMMNQEKPLLA